MRAAVDAVGEDGVVSGLEDGHEGAGDPGHAGVEQQGASLTISVIDPLEGGNLSCRRLVGRGAPPAVDVAVLVGVRRLSLGVEAGPVVGVLQGEGRAEVDRRGEAGGSSSGRLVQVGALGGEGGGVLAGGCAGGGGEVALDCSRGGGGDSSRCYYDGVQDRHVLCSFLFFRKICEIYLKRVANRALRTPKQQGRAFKLKSGADEVPVQRQ